MAKHTLILTQQCNLRCRYCCVAKTNAVMPFETVRRAVYFSFAHTPAGEPVDIGFFGGEPLLEFPLLREATAAIKAHPDARRRRVRLSVISNGTVYSDEIADFLEREEVHLCMSCDGPPAVQDAARRFYDGGPSSAVVEDNLRRALQRFPDLRVNAVYGPQTLRSLPDSVDYLATLGVNQIHLNPDYSAPWRAADLADLPAVYARVGEVYGRYRRRRPLFVSLLDSKIAVILRHGYQPGERCRMGEAEFAYVPAGWIYPCERLVGIGDGGEHCIGHLDTGVERVGGARGETGATSAECTACDLQRYCMRGCGCSNYFASGRYDRVNAFLCASERAAIQAAFDVFHRLEQEQGPGFFERASAGAVSFGPARDIAGTAGRLG